MAEVKEPEGIFTSDEIIPDVVDVEPNKVLLIQFADDKDKCPVTKPGDELDLKFVCLFIST